jgi:CelD/BcsL family acetyltransferase involved in cellulose biosynthesis
LEHQIIDRVEDFRALAAHWARLASAGGVRTPYQSFAWLEQWLTHRATGIDPFVILLHNNETIAPMGRAIKAGLRQLRLLGAPDSDYVGLVTIRPLDEAWDGVARVCAEHRRAFDVVHLQSVRDHEMILAALKRHLGGRGRERTYELCPWIPTDRSWEEVRTSRGSGLRNELKRWERRIRELGRPETTHIGPPLTDELVSELEAVERDSWKWEQGDSAFQVGPQCDFLHALLRDPRAGIAIWLMRVSGRLVAYALVLVDNDRWYYYLPSFRKDVPNAGSLLLAQIVEAACNSGRTAVDLLRGDHGYKRSWTDRVDSVHEIVWPSSLRGRVVTLAYATRWQAARSPRLRKLRARLGRGGDRRPSRTAKEIAGLSQRIQVRGRAQ